MGAQFCSSKPGYSSVVFQCTLAQPGRRAGMDAPERTEEGGWAATEPAHLGRSLAVTPTSTDLLLCLAADSDAASCLEKMQDNVLFFCTMCYTRPQQP